MHRPASLSATPARRPTLALALGSALAFSACIGQVSPLRAGGGNGTAGAGDPPRGAGGGGGTGVVSGTGGRIITGAGGGGGVAPPVTGTGGAAFGDCQPTADPG